MNLQQASTHIIKQLQAIYTARESQNICNLFLEYITNLSRAERLINKELQLTEIQKTKINIGLVQLLQHKPIQQVIGYAYFANNTFLVNENVLIPRQETEELIALIINENKNKSISILDIGTGCGCIGISLQQQLPNATITAIDISKKAIDIAKQNAKNINVAIDFLKENSCKALPMYDVIVSNPPYITQNEKLEMQKNVLNHEPHLALFAPINNALFFYEKIAHFATTHLNKNGNIYVEINETLGNQTAKTFIDKGFNAVVIKDMQEKDRIIKANFM
jgi:release factor glutamine methyltransferase